MDGRLERKYTKKNNTNKNWYKSMDMKEDIKTNGSMVKTKERKMLCIFMIQENT